ncbi:MAG TPA: hypothetical protein VM782_06030 [Stellaceae bacterium]|nr:hypothetical protein [Stellaceae bacterium]
MNEKMSPGDGMVGKVRRRGMAVPRGGREASRLAACVLEVLAGVRTPTEAAQELGVSLPRYYQLEQRALQGLVAGCAPAPRGRVMSPESANARLRRDNERLTRECQRQQALVRLARQAAGLANPAAKPSTGSEPGGPKRRVRRTVRGHEAARRLRQQAEAVTAGPSGEEPAAG